MDNETDENKFVHLRHKPFAALPENCELVLAVPQLKSNVNLARIARAAGCCGVGKMIVEGNSKIDPKIARDAANTISFVSRRSLLPTLQKEKKQGTYSLVGLEQTTNSKQINEFKFQPKTMLVIGHERNGITEDILAILDATVEIPVFGLPYSFNVATATAIALYEFNRQHLGNDKQA